MSQNTHILIATPVTYVLRLAVTVTLASFWWVATVALVLGMLAVTYGWPPHLPASLEVPLWITRPLGMDAHVYVATGAVLLIAASLTLLQFVGVVLAIAKEQRRLVERVVAQEVLSRPRSILADQGPRLPRPRTVSGGKLPLRRKFSGIALASGIRARR